MFRSRVCYLLLLAGLLAARVGHAEESEADRRARLKAMPVEEKEELLQKSERFVTLPDAEKARLRALHTEISSATDGERLTHVLERYHAWLATLSSAERSELLSLPSDKRLAKMKELVRAQEEKQFRELVKANLQPEDRKAIFTFLEEFAEAHKVAILESVPKDFRPQKLDGQSRWPVLMHVLRRWAENDPKVPKPSKEDVERLIATLSPKARQLLESARDPDARTTLAQNWIRAAVMSRGMPTMPAPSQEELRRFMQNELSTQERERLESLPAEEMPVALQRAYFEHRWGHRGGGRGGPGPGGFGPGGREGPGGRGPGPGEFGPGGPDGPPPMDEGGGRRGGRDRDDRKGPRDDFKGKDDRKGKREDRPLPPESGEPKKDE